MGSKFRIHPGACLLGALWLLMIPPGWGIGALLAALIHELCHFGAVLACGGKVLAVSVLPYGARMDTSPMSPGAQTVSALAGPLGSFSLLLIAQFFPEAALCGLIQGLYNLLPIYPLDGGRILQCLLPTSVCKGIEFFALTLLSGVCMWLAVDMKLHELALVLLISVWAPVFRINISCKESKMAVQ